MPHQRWNRRVFFRKTGVSLGGAALLYACHQPGETWSYLTPTEAELLGDLLDQIIPADEDPGAREAGVIYFIDRQLVGPYKRFQEAYRAGLKNLEATSRAIDGSSFVGLGRNDQTRLLQQLQLDQVPGDAWPEQSASSFFGMVVDHAMQGFYGSPIHGGNQDFVSYRMLGIALPIDYEEQSS